MLLTESQLNRVRDQLCAYRLLLKHLAQITPDAALLARDADQLLCELERIAIDDDIEHALLEVCNV